MRLVIYFSLEGFTWGFIEQDVERVNNICSLYFYQKMTEIKKPLLGIWVYVCRHAYVNDHISTENTIEGYIVSHSLIWIRVL